LPNAVVVDDHQHRTVSQRRPAGRRRRIQLQRAVSRWASGLTDYAFNTIGGSASVTGLRTCWDGFSHNTGGGNVQLVDNQTAIEDGNLVTAISSGTI